AGVNRRRRLDAARNRRPRVRLDFAVQGADDAGPEAVIEAEWVADGVGTLADDQVLRLADVDGLQLGRRGVNSQYCDIPRAAAAYQTGLMPGAVVERNHRGVGPFDDMVVGDDVAVLVPDDAGAGAARDALQVARGRVPPDVQRGNVDHRGLGVLV